MQKGRITSDTKSGIVFFKSCNDFPINNNADFGKLVFK